MAEKRTVWERIFGKETEQSSPKDATQFKFMNGYVPVFTHFGDDPYSSDVVRSAIHAIASNAAKLKPKHIRKANGDIRHINNSLEYLLSVRPNEFMNAYDFYYKLVTQRMLYNNAFAYISYDKDTGKVNGFYPVDMGHVELLEARSELYVKFNLPDGKKLVRHYSQFIHLRRFFSKNDMFGESNGAALLPTLDLIHATDEGITNAVKSSAFLRGIIKFTNSMLKVEDLKRQRDDFVKDFMGMNNNGGIAALDSKADYKELKTDPKMIDSKQMQLIEEKVHKYFGVNKSIIMSDYKEEQWNAFYENTIEPIAIQLSLEFSNKLFTERERGHGNEVVFESNRLAYASNTTKVSMVRELAPLGILSKNEAREIFNMAPIEGGEAFIQTLNVVSADKADQYQGVDDKDATKGGETDDKEDDDPEASGED